MEEGKGAGGGGGDAGRGEDKVSDLPGPQAEDPDLVPESQTRCRKVAMGPSRQPGDQKRGGRRCGEAGDAEGREAGLSELEEVIRTGLGVCVWGGRMAGNGKGWVFSATRLRDSGGQGPRPGILSPPCLAQSLALRTG